MSHDQSTTPTSRNRGEATLPRLARFLHTHRRSVLIGAVICAVVAGTFGVGENRAWRI